MEYPIFVGAHRAGTVTRQREGLYTVLEAWLPEADGLLRLWAVGADGEQTNLGVMEPRAGGAYLRRRLSRMDMLRLPEDIDHFEARDRQHPPQPPRPPQPPQPPRPPQPPQPPRPPQPPQPPRPPQPPQPPRPPHTPQPPQPPQPPRPPHTPQPPRPPRPPHHKAAKTQPDGATPSGPVEKAAAETTNDDVHESLTNAGADICYNEAESISLQWFTRPDGTLVSFDGRRHMLALPAQLRRGVPGARIIIINNKEYIAFWY